MTNSFHPASRENQTTLSDGPVIPVRFITERGLVRAITAVFLSKRRDGSDYVP